MEVGLVTYGDLGQVSGGYRYNRKLVAYLRACGDRVTVISLSERRGPWAVVDNFSPQIRRRLDRPFDVLIQDELCYRSLLRHTDRLDAPDRVIALVHLLERPEMGGTRLAETIERRYLASVDGCIATSRHTARAIDAMTDTETVVAHPGGRHTDGAVPAAQVTQRATSGPLAVTFVGNIAPRKGLHTLVDALADVDAEWTATIVGEPRDRDYASRVQRLIDELPNAGDVTVTGRVSGERLSAILERSDVLAVPSTYESFGMVYLEAMEYGVVPIAAAVGGAREVVDHGTNGFLVPADAPGVLARQLSTLATNRDRLAAMGTAALATARSHPTWTESMARARSAMKTDHQ